MKIEELKFDGYERVVQGTKDGFRATIAIHNINLGPALGGCRAYDYSDNQSQVEDTLKLAKGMTYKNALAGLSIGGGKSTLSTAGFTEDNLKMFGDLLNHVNKDGHVYTTAGDVGTTNDDLRVLGKYTPFVNGSTGSDSGIATAFGVFSAMKGALRSAGRDIKETTVSVNGYGKVGKRLTKFLLDAGANVIVSDINPLPADEFIPGGLGKSAINMAHVNSDVFAPCALGGALNHKVMDGIAVGHIVCGGANNQLASEDIAERIAEKGIFYVPDYLANSGGVIIVSRRGEDMFDYEYDAPQVHSKLQALEDTTFAILEESKMTGKFSGDIADSMAENIFNK